MARSKNHRNLAVIGAGVGVATAGVITYLVVAGAPKEPEETRELVRPTQSASLDNVEVEGSEAKPFAAKQPTKEELAELAKADEIEKAERIAEEKAATAAHAKAAREAALEQARQFGLLGSTALRQGGSFASLTGTDDISSGFDDASIGGLTGGGSGGFGYGRSGFGPGGGGTGWGTIGTGRYGKIGHGSGTGSGYGGRTKVPTVTIGQPNGQGDLDKAIIRRYIKRNIQRIQACYEKELVNKPTLAGTVSTQFTITPTGTVEGATGSGVDPTVSTCVANVIAAIEFPKPKSGGSVKVAYPFTFRPADKP